MEADWPLIGGACRIEGIKVSWPKKAQEHLLAGGQLSAVQVEAVHRHLAQASPLA